MGGGASINGCQILLLRGQLSLSGLMIFFKRPVVESTRPTHTPCVNAHTLLVVERGKG